MKLALTLGDPAGVGIEITLKALQRLPAELLDALILYGHRASFEAARRSLALPDHLDFVDVLPDIAEPLPLARATADGARAQYLALTRAIDDALEGHVDGIVTAPWTKHALALAGLPPTGHTEVLTERSGASRSVMLLAGDELRVALVTAHAPLAEVPSLITPERIQGVIEEVHDAGVRLYGMERPRIAVCGLNPHAGEGGVLGLEDDAIIAPVVDRMAKAGIAVSGPYPADTLFGRVVREQTADFVVAMYHDQGLGPLKLWHQGQAANVTLGLPFVRTSVDHGTAYDIAGRGVARSESLEYATRLAARFVGSLRERPGTR